MIASYRLTYRSGTSPRRRSRLPHTVLALNLLPGQPLGWLLLAWHKMLLFGPLALAAGRYRNPMALVGGLALSGREYIRQRREKKQARDSRNLQGVWQVYRNHVLAEWPKIADRLVALGFDNRVRRISTAAGNEKPTVSRWSDLWEDIVDDSVNEVASRLSRGWLQFIFNLPTVLLGLVIFVSVAYRYGEVVLAGKDAFPVSYFLHAFITLLLLLFLSFLLLQLAMRWMGGTRILRLRVDGAASPR